MSTHPTIAAWEKVRDVDNYDRAQMVKAMNGVGDAFRGRPVSVSDFAALGVIAASENRIKSEAALVKVDAEIEKLRKQRGQLVRIIGNQKAAEFNARKQLAAVEALDQ